MTAALDIIEPRIQPDALLVVVHGAVVGQGSKTRGRYGNIRDDNADRLKPWRDNIRSAALDAIASSGWRTLQSEVEVEVTFTFARPKAHYGTGRNAGVLRDWAPKRPACYVDIDKACRAALDSLTDAAVFEDDKQVTDLHARKRFAGTGEDALDHPGAVIRIRAV